MKKYPYLRSRYRRGRLFHYYRRDGKEISLGVNGIRHEDPRVIAAWAAQHARWEESKPGAETVRSGTFEWAVDLYRKSSHWETLSRETQKNRNAILDRCVRASGSRRLSEITAQSIEAGLATKTGNAAINQLKALRPVFEHAVKLRFLERDPTTGIKIKRPKTRGFETASPVDIKKFRARWPVGTTERLMFDLALYTGAARVDLASLSRANIEGDLLLYTRHKTKVECIVPLTPALRAVVARTPDIAPAFLLTSHGKPFTVAGLGNRFGDAASEAGVSFRLHGLRKAFCVYWAEHGYSTHQIATMAGHITLGEVERYTRALDRRRMIESIERTGR